MENMESVTLKQIQKRYYDKKDKMSNQRKYHYEKSSDKVLQQRKDNYIFF